VHALAIVAILVPLPASADLYTAAAAYQKQDFARSFEVYRELAELGRREAQENLAAMYVDGEGVKRDNALGYAWAVIAKENGGGAGVQNIIDQLEPHLTPAARARAAEVQSKFGMVALSERLLPTPDLPGAPLTAPCKVAGAADPGTYYPSEAKASELSGAVQLEVTVAPSGRARNVHVLYSLPTRVFDVPGRRVAFDTRYTTPRESGVAVSCTLQFKVKFKISVDGAKPEASSELKESTAESKAKADAGDPGAQLLYGLLLETRSELNTKREDVMPWFVKAAQAGMPIAQYLVGIRLLSGIDETKGLRWLQLAADAGQPDAQAALGNYLLRRKPDSEALAKAQGLLEKAAASDSRDGKYELAALLATSPDAERRDPKRALDLLKQIIQYVDFDPTVFEIRAAAEAMLGDFEAALGDQKTALEKARKLGWDLKDLEARLADYTAGRTWSGDLFAFY
jgi:TonB family protein